MATSFDAHVRKRKMGKDPCNADLFSPPSDSNTPNRQMMGSGRNDISKTDSSADRNNAPLRSTAKLDTNTDLGHGFRETSLSRPLLSGSDSESEIHEGVTIVSTPEVKSPIEDEKSWQIGIQVFIPYMIAGFGMVAAGLVLDYVQVSAHD